MAACVAVCVALWARALSLEALMQQVEILKSQSAIELTV